MRNAYRAGSFLAALFAAGILWPLAGCRSPDAGKPIRPPQSSTELSADSEQFAEALALFSHGLMQQLHGDSGAALTNYLKAVVLDPDNDELYLRIAMAQLRQRDLPAAIGTLQTLRERRPQSDRPLLWLGLVYRSADQREKAIEIYREATRLMPQNYAAYLELASMYIRDGKHDDAIALLDTAIDKVDEPNDLLRLLGELYIRKSATGDPEHANRRAAIDTFERAIAHEPNDVALLDQLGELYFLEKDMEKAIEYFERIAELEPDNLQIKKKLALTFAATGNQQKAVETLEKIAQQQTVSSSVYYNLAELYEKLGEKDKAILNYGFAATSAKPEPEPYVKMALLQMDDQPDEALASLLDGLERLPRSVRLMEMLAYVYLSQRQYQEAAEAFAKTEKLLQEGEEGQVTPFFYFQAAIATQHAGQLERVSKYLVKAIQSNRAFLDTYIQYVFQQEKAVQTDALGVLTETAEALPEEHGLFIYIGLLHSFAKDYKASIEAFEKVSELVEAADESVALDANYYFWYGAACERDEQFDRAVELFRKCIEVDPKHDEAYNYLAYMWAEKGINLDEALEHIQKALQLRPDSGAFIDTLGWIYYMQGKYEDALLQIEKAAEIVPHDATIVDHLGDIHLKLGDEEKALQYWEESFILEPENEKVEEKLRQRGVDIGVLRRRSEERAREKKAAETAAAASPEDEKAPGEPSPTPDPSVTK